jgi:cytochrome b561
MNHGNNNQQWGWPGKVFHWVTALLILIQIPVGFFSKVMKLSPLKLDLFVWHKSIGFIILLLVISRMLWRINGSVPSAAADTAIRQTLARTSHGLLYALMLLLPISGWIISSAANIPISLFWLLELPAITGPDEALKGVAGTIHGTCVVLLLAVLTLHIGAALRHHFILRDNVLTRLWF